MPAKRPRKAPQRHIRIVLLDEFPIFSEALGTVISLQPDMEYVASATTPDDAVQLVMDLSPDVVVIDVDLPGPNGSAEGGLDATRRVKVARPETRVVILAAKLDLSTMARAASAGACGFLPKTGHVSDICEAIRTAKDGGMFVEQELVAPLVERLRTSIRVPITGGSARAEITTREQDVLSLLGEGLDVATIASRLAVSISTTRSHVKSLLVKLGSHSQLEAVVEAVHQGLLPHLKS